MDKDSRRRKTWSLAIILQVIAPVRDVSPDITSIKRSCFDKNYTVDDDSTMDVSPKRKKVGANKRANAGSESQNSTYKTNANMNVGANAGTESQNSTWENKGDVDSQSHHIRIPLSLMDLSSDDTISPIEENKTAGQKTYKLIDGVPSLTKTMKKTSYIIQYDNRTRNAAWVFEILNEETLKGNAKRKTFSEDLMIHEHYRTLDEQYTNTNYQKGHLAAAANHKWSQKATDDTFLLSNIAPQNNNMNMGKWKVLENMCKEYTKDCRFCVHWSTLLR